MSTKNVPQVKKEIGEVVRLITTGALNNFVHVTLLKVHEQVVRGVRVIPQELFPTKPMKQIGKSPVPQVVKGMVEQERMQKHIGDATGKIAKMVDVPGAIQTVSEDCGNSTNAIPSLRSLRTCCDTAANAFE